MKYLTTLTLLIACSFVIQKLHGQNSISVLTGIQSSRMHTTGLATDLLDYQSILRPHAGVLYARSIGHGFEAQGGLNFSQRGFSLYAGTYASMFGLDIPLGLTATTEINSFELPLRIKYTAYKGDNLSAYINGGVQLNYSHSANLEMRANSIIDLKLYETEIDLGADGFNQWGSDAVIGAGIQYEKDSGFFMAQLDYIRSLNDFTDAGVTIIDPGIRFSQWRVSVGYGIRF